MPPPALAVDGCSETRAGLAPLLGRGWCEFEFDTDRRNGGPGKPDAPPDGDGTAADTMGLVN